MLGDLYQDLSAAVRERHALLQTPDFVEKFILNETLESAIKEFGLEQVRLLDPTCGSGHFLLGAFERLVDHWLRSFPGLSKGDAAKKALEQVAGADLNPYAIAIARFRLTLAYFKAAGITRLKDAPRELQLNLAVADSLLHGIHPQGAAGNQLPFSRVATDTAAWGDRMFRLEDPVATEDVLGKPYHAVVGNPPYITCKDAKLRELYRGMYPRSAAGKYALAAPFNERFFQLAVPGGFMGMINANSFMKREFGKKLIEEALPQFELSRVIDTSGAFIPGHGTPTVILFGRNRTATGGAVPAVLGKRGEPSTPEDSSKGQVWGSIEAHFAEVGFENDFISVAEVPRATFAKHPWSLGGGGAAELKELLEARAEKQLWHVCESIGISAFTLEDDVYIRPMSAWPRVGVPVERVREMIVGEAIRDWSVGEVESCFFPYDVNLATLGPELDELRALWPHRTNLANSKMFGNKTKVQYGLKWYEYGRLTADKLRTPLSITFAEVATHNHFVLDRGGKVFKQTAPVSGFVEPISPSREAYHVLAHQLLGLTMESDGLPRAGWFERLRAASSFTEIAPEDGEALVSHMLQEHILIETDSRLALGPRGEKLYGKRNYMELYSVFSTPRVMRVEWAKEEIGSVDTDFLQALDEKDGPSSFILSGRAWKIEHVDWDKGFREAAANSSAAVRELIAKYRQDGRPNADDVTKAAASVIGRFRLSKFQPCLPPRLELRLAGQVATDAVGARSSLEARA